MGLAIRLQGAVNPRRLWASASSKVPIRGAREHTGCQRPDCDPIEAQGRPPGRPPLLAPRTRTYRVNRKVMSELNRRVTSRSPSILPTMMSSLKRIASVSGALDRLPLALLEVAVDLEVGHRVGRARVARQGLRQRDEAGTCVNCKPTSRRR